MEKFTIIILIIIVVVIVVIIEYSTSELLG